MTALKQLSRIRRQACERKVRHTSHAAAWEAMKTVQHQLGYRGRMQVYCCRFCGGYHFGHLPRNTGTPT